MAFRLVNRERLMAPRKCIVCESHPTHRVVDTGYNLTAATVLDKLRGRKYICEACGEKIGKALGMLVQGQVNTLKERIIALEAREAELVEQVQIGDRLEELKGYLVGMNNGDEVSAPVPDES